MIEYGADVKIKTKSYTPLIAACEYGENITLCKYLISKGANVNAKTEMRNSVLIHAY